MNKKFESYEFNVKKIQKKWKLLKTRKLIYKATIRNIWNKNLQNLMYIIKKEKQSAFSENSGGLNEKLLLNSMLLGNIRSRKNDPTSNFTLDL